MKRTRWWWAVGLVGAGMVAGAALALAARGGMALADRSTGNDVADGPGAEHIAGAVRDPHACDDDCRRSRGAAALMVLSQRPAP
ncbi:hypothetical protein [Cupriavidus necator]